MKIINPTLHQIEAFVLACHLGSITAAAERMRLTQSAVSILLRQLERGLGARLLDRTTRSLHPTAAGLEMLPRAERMLRDRVVSLRNANIYSPSIYRHFLSGLQVEAGVADSVELRCNYLVINSNQIGQSLVYQTGRYFDRVVRTADGWRFAKKRAVFDTSRVQTLLAIPI